MGHAEMGEPTETTNEGAWVRTAGSAVLMFLAALLALGAVTGSLVDRLAHSPGPARDMAATLPQDDAVRAALPPLLVQGILADVPAGINVPEALGNVLERAGTRAVNAVLDSDGFQGAWLESVDESRQSYVDRLEAVRTGTAETAPATLVLGPLATRGVQRLKNDAQGIGLGVLAGSLPDDVQASVGLDVPGTDAAGSARNATVVWASGFWGWAAAAAVLLAVTAVVAARPRARGGILVLGGFLTSLWAAGLLVAASAVASSHAEAVGSVTQGETPTAPEASAMLAEAVRSHVSQVIAGEVHAAAVASLAGGGAVLVLGLVIRLIEDRRRNG